jgi:molybdate transport system substrate-binding protein
MKFLLVGTAAATVLANIFNCGIAAMAAEVKVLAGNALAGSIGELAPSFERASGHKVLAQYGLSRTFKPRIESGEAVDLIVLSLETMDDLEKQGKISPGTRCNIARTGIGVAVRAGGTKPDIATVDSFKRALLAAKTISWAPRTETGEHLAKVFERLGITEEIKSKTKAQQAVDRVAQAVADGEAELAITVTSLLTNPGVAMVGKIPAELQTYLVFTAGVGTTAMEPNAAKALAKHLISPGAAPVFTARGWEPASR